MWFQKYSFLYSESQMKQPMRFEKYLLWNLRYFESRKRQTMRFEKLLMRCSENRRK
jgi:hypothetical protein